MMIKHSIIDDRLHMSVCMEEAGYLEHQDPMSALRGNEPGVCLEGSAGNFLSLKS